MLYFISIMSIVFMAIALLEIKRTRFYLNPLSLFLLEWCVVLLFSGLHLYGLYEPEDSTVILFFIGIVMFTIGYYIQTIALKKYHLSIGKKRLFYSEDVEPRYRMLIRAAVFSIGYYLLYLYMVYRNLGSFNLWAVQQYLRRNSEIISNQYIRALGAFIFGPISFSLPIIVSADFWFGKRNKKLLWLTIILITIQMIATASRMTFILFVLYMVSIGFYKLAVSGRLNSKKAKKSIKRWIGAIVIGGIGAFIAMSISRQLTVLKSMYLQISIPPVMFDIWKVEVDQKNLLGFGDASLNGFFFPVLYVIQKALGMPQLPPNMQAIYDLINYTDSYWVDAGVGITANAYVSIFWFLYVDARYFGVVVGMLIFGMYAGNAYSNIRTNFNCRNLSLYCICIVAVFFSLVRMQFARANFALAMLFLMFVAFKRVRKERM